jgi:hypothetical protein
MRRVPSPSDIVYGIRRRARRAREAMRGRLRGVRYLLADVVFVAGRVPRAAARAGREFWFGLGLETRQRFAMAVAAVVAIALLWAIAIPALPCQFPGGDRCPPSDDAIDLVPADALAYVHFNVDPGTEQYEDATPIAESLPNVTRQLAGRLLARVPGPNGAPPSLADDIRPWFGGEAALAVLPGTGRVSEEVQLLEASDSDGARAFADSIAAGTPQTTTYQGVEISTDQRGLATAVTGGFLVIGRESGVRDVIDAATGASGATSLADSEPATQARDALPDKRLADAYLSEDGISALVSSSTGTLATLGPFISPGSSRGAALALVATDGGLDLDVRSELDPEREKTHPGFFTAFPTFQPVLPEALQSDSLAYLGIGDAGEAFRALLQQATAEQPGLAAAFGSFFDRVKRLGHVDLQSDLFPSLGGEAAVGVEPAPASPAEGSGKPGGGTGALSPSESPFLEFVGSGVNTDSASQALAKLQGPLADALNPQGGGQAPVFNARKIGDVEAQSLRLSPTVNLTYALFDSLLAVATDPAGIEELVAGDGGLAGSDRFGEATDGLPSQVALEAYLDLGGLITLGERAGLARDPAYATFAPEIRKLEALGIAVTQSPSEVATDVRLAVAPGPPEAPTGIPAAPGNGGG